MGKLDQRVAIVTGGARGIGKQIALTFAREGANIVIGDKLVPEMEATGREISNLKRKVLTKEADVSKKDDVRRLIGAALETFKKVDILVNNAGLTRFASVIEMTEEDWDLVMNVNLKGVFLCTQAAAPQMIQQKYGKIINIASVVGLGAVAPGAANYAASKGGVVLLTKVCARELGPSGINVNAIAPGTILTDLTHSRRTPEQVEQLLSEKRKTAALGKTGVTQDIANLALFLASEDSSFITGQVIAADGGRADRM